MMWPWQGMIWDGSELSFVLTASSDILHRISGGGANTGEWDAVQPGECAGRWKAVSGDDRGGWGRARRAQGKSGESQAYQAEPGRERDEALRAELQNRSKSGNQHHRRQFLPSRARWRPSAKGQRPMRGGNFCRGRRGASRLV